MDIIKQLNWRYATKKFHKNKKISENDFNEILEAFRLSASSLGFQHYKMLVVNDAQLREQLKPFTWDQAQTTDASHYVVLCTYNTLTDEDIDKHTNNINKIRNQPKEKGDAYAKRIRFFLKGKTPDMVYNWLSRQVYIALGNVMTVCAMKNIDTCAIGGFQPEEYIEVLQLREKNLTPLVCLALGYRSEEDSYQHVNKVRKPMDKMVEFV